ncbi:Ran GTPase-activating protein 1 [Escovopsis weberi]|uniref:Ran GTPase-activating protein 1 n=1 Tax=Escovopsis weberi TaxID=150374 RepID=A0A0M8MZ50_ESCWE|nr:Ran GTPase-activating protein 1 [Escovopsis weberi]
MAASHKIFSIEGKGLKLDTAADLEPHVAALRAMDDVEEVRFLGNSLGVGACKLIGEILATKKSLQVANFADIFTGRLLNEIPEALSSILTSVLNHPRLHTVNLNDNAFGLNTQAPLVAFLAAHVPLQHLYLNNNGLGPHAGILVADALSALHAAKQAARRDAPADGPAATVPDLETVVCGRNRLENGSMTAWARAYSLHNSIRTVKMVQNGIRQEGIAHLIANGLRHAARLAVLDLQDNTFTVSGARALAKTVSAWPAIRELGVGDSLLGARGGVLLAQALAAGHNKHLEVLRLQYNEIKANGVKAFADAARNALPALKRIELNGNKFTEEDDSIIVLQELLDERRESSPEESSQDDEWGVDSLSDLEELDSEEEESEEEEEEEGEEEEEEVTKKAEKLIKEAEEAQEEPVIQRQDKEVDELAKKLEKTDV